MYCFLKFLWIYLHSVYVCSPKHRAWTKFVIINSLCTVPHWNINFVHCILRLTVGPRENGRLFADDIFTCIFLKEKVWISINISLKFVPEDQINNIPALGLIMAWRRPGNKPLSEPMMVRSLTHIRVTRPQWVNDVEMTQCYPFRRWIVTAYSNNNSEKKISKIFIDAYFEKFQLTFAHYHAENENPSIICIKIQHRGLTGPPLPTEISWISIGFRMWITKSHWFKCESCVHLFMTQIQRRHRQTSRQTDRDRQTHTHNTTQHITQTQTHTQL